MQQVITNPDRGAIRAKGIHVAEWLVSQKVDRVMLKEDFHGQGPDYVFAEAGVQILHTRAESVAEALAEVNG